MSEDSGVRVSLGIESVQTQADWDDWRLLGFLGKGGFLAARS